MSKPKPIVGLIMGSVNDWDTMHKAHEVLNQFQVSHEVRVISAHRTPGQLYRYASSAEARGLEVIIAGAGGAAHLPGMLAALTLLPIIGVPMQSKALNGLDSLLSIVQMPTSVPVGTMAIGDAGARNAALYAVAILARKFEQFRQPLMDYRKSMADLVFGDNIDIINEIASDEKLKGDLDELG